MKVEDSSRGVEITAILANLLSRVVPDGFNVVAAGGVLRVRHETDASGVRAYVAEIVDQGPEYSFAVTGVLSALNTVQDYICETLTEPWPSERFGGFALRRTASEHRGWEAPGMVR